MREDRLECHDWGTDGYPGEFVYGDDVYVDDYYMDERWLPVEDYPGYWVSDKARVWSSRSNRFLSIHPADDWGHLGINPCKNGTAYHEYIHRLMGKAFIPNPNNLPLVRHLDDVPYNNDLENLAWGTNKDNTRDAIKNGHFRFATKEDREKALAACRVPVVAIDIETGDRLEFNGVATAIRELGISKTSIHRVLSGKRESINGYRIEYLDKEMVSE